MGAPNTLPHIWAAAGNVATDLLEIQSDGMFKEGVNTTLDKQAAESMRLLNLLGYDIIGIRTIVSLQGVGLLYVFLYIHDRIADLNPKD